MDAVRGGAVLLVVFFHAATLMRYAKVESPALVSLVNDVAAPFRMPTLVFLSGLFVAGSLRKGSRRYFAGKLRMVAWPYAVWIGIFFVLSWPVMYPANFLSGGTWLWFLAFLMFFYVAAWSLQKVPPSAVVAFAFAASWLAEDGSKWGERLFLLFAFFMAGYWASRRPAAWAALLSRQWALAIAALVTTVFAALSWLRVVESPDGYAPALAWGSAAGVMLIIRVARALEGRSWMLPLRFCGRHSLVFYVMHFPAMYVLAHLLEHAGLASAAGSWGTYLALLVTALGAAIVAGLFMDRAPALRLQWLFRWPEPNHVDVPSARLEPCRPQARPTPRVRDTKADILLRTSQRP